MPSIAEMTPASKPDPIVPPPPASPPPAVPLHPEELQMHARLAAYFGAAILGNRIIDAQVSTILEGELYTDEDYFRLGRRAGHHGLKVLAAIEAGQALEVQRAMVGAQ